MREQTMALGRIIALVLATITVILFRPALSEIHQSVTADLQKITPVQDVQVSAANSNVPQAQTAVAHVEAAQQPAQEQPKEPPRPAPWAAVTSPNGGTDWVNKALAHYQTMGLTKQGAAMLVGNFLQEKPSAFVTGDPCGGILGDGGKAHGFGQWHPGRRVDMPCGFYEQLTWAVSVEMQRDGGGKQLYPLLFDANASTYDLDWGLKQWERYGHKGQRYYYGTAILKQL